ncbi:uncharacterized protein N7477_002283 [Penicillium maclennaniae]|uniref:uncharacterized protein n=1 Tax=Penicillium maclennaniae TaxID=1343394 RepID=UPI0025404EBC|nr:uncharacterized protein N7477_002283 [Penicillium maclennaniae]KAJ5676650.1 hypothetical protein N7477_002283 [Penicillium maclennaniae]
MNESQLAEETAATSRPNSPASSVNSNDRLNHDEENDSNEDTAPRTTLPATIAPEAATETSFPSPDIDKSHKQKPNTKRPISARISDWFIWEILAMIFSMCLLIAIIVVLAHFNHRAQPTWKYVSLNSIVSWLSTLSKGCVLFTIKLVVDESQSATVGNTSFFNSIGLSGMGDDLVDPTLKANVYNALFSNVKSKPWSIPNYTCTTGNYQLNTTCQTTHAWPYEDGSNNCSLTLPGGGNEAYYISGSPEGHPLAMGEILLPSSNDPYHLLPYIQLIAPDGLFNGSPHTTRTKYQAMKCNLSPIVRSLRAQVIRGVYHETTLDTWTNYTRESKGLLYPPWGPEKGMQYNQSFGISDDSLITFAEFIVELFTGYVQADHEGLYGFGYGGIGTTNYASIDCIEAIAFGNITGCEVNNASKLECAMSNVAAAMSKTFRDSAYADDESALSPLSGNNATNGQAFSSVTHIAVHWQWIISPMLVWVLGLISLIGAVSKSRKASIPRWKNDPIPLLFLCENIHSDHVTGNEKAENSPDVRLCIEGDQMMLRREFNA